MTRLSDLPVVVCMNRLVLQHLPHLSDVDHNLFIPPSEVSSQEEQAPAFDALFPV